MAPPKLARRYSGILFRVFVVSRLVARLLEQEVRAVPSDQLGVFSAIASWQPITPTELAKRSGIKPTTLSNIIRRMEEAGVVSKRTNPSDSRSYLLSLTRQGRALWRKAGPALGQTIAMVESTLGDDLEDVIQSLDELETHLRHLVGEAQAADLASRASA